MLRLRGSLVIVVALLLLHVAPAPAAHADAIDDYIKTEMERRHIPGLALAVARNGKIIKVRGYGVANLEHDVPVTPDTVFELASVTKQFTATAIMLLVEEGKVQLDDQVAWHLPRAPETWKAITVRHLLTHTSPAAGASPTPRRRCSTPLRRTRSNSPRASASCTATSAISCSA